MTDYQDKIQQHYKTLSNRLLKVAEHLWAHPDQFAVKTAREIGETIGVSETSVIRLTYTLGYSGYSKLQQEVREALFVNKSSLDTYRRDREALTDQHHLYEQVMMQDRENILQTAHDIEDDDFREAVHRLSRARHILSSGVRTSHAMAHWFVFVMNLIRGGARLYHPATDDVILQVADMNKDDVFVAFSFHRYAEETLQLTRAMKAQGVFIVAVTDSVVAPIAADADLVFPVKQSTRSTIDAAPICFSFLNALTSAVSLEDPERFESRRQYYEQHHLQQFFAKGAEGHDKY